MLPPPPLAVEQAPGLLVGQAGRGAAVHRRDEVALPHEALGGAARVHPGYAEGVGAIDAARDPEAPWWAACERRYWFSFTCYI